MMDDIAYRYLCGLAAAYARGRNVELVQRVAALAAILEPGEAVGCDWCGKVHHAALLETVDDLVPSRQSVGYDANGDAEAIICGLCVLEMWAADTPYGFPKEFPDPNAPWVWAMSELSDNDRRSDEQDTLAALEGP